MICVQDISVMIGSQALLEAVSFSQELGTFTAIVGPNGSGKSTLMKVLCGNFPSQKDKIKLLQKKLDTWKPSELAKYRGMLPQESSLSFPFSVEEVVRMGLFPHGNMSSHFEEDPTSELLHLVGMKHLKKRIYTVLSGGEKQRTHLARVLAQIWSKLGKEPTVLLADEPTNGLDIKYQHQALSLFKDMAGKKCTVLSVIHDLQLAAQYADRILLMNQGSLITQGTPSEVLTPENIERVFGVKVQHHSHVQVSWPYTVMSSNTPLKTL